VTRAPRLSKRRSRVILGVALTLVALVPFIVAIGTRAGHKYVPVGDFALMDLRVRDVWSSEIPLVGAYSRFGWNHPGPAAYYLLAPVSGITGTAAWGTLVANALVQAVVVAAIAYVAWRSGGIARLLAALAFMGLAYGAMGPSMVLDAWNPNVAFPMFPLFVLLAWVLATGKPRALVFSVIAASILVQAHVGYLPLVAAAGVCALAFALRHTGRAWTTWKRPALWSLLAFVIIWIPPVLQEFVHGSNLRPLADSLTSSDEPTLGAREAARILAEEFEIPPPWLGGHHELNGITNTVDGASPVWLLIPAALLTGAWIATRRRRRPASLELLAITTTLTVVGFLALTRVLGAAERYVFYWRVPLALLIVFSSIWSIWIALDLDRNRLANQLAAAALALVVVVASITLSVRIGQTDRISPSEAVARAAISAVEPKLDPRTRVIVRAADTPFLGVQRAVVNELDRKGDDVRVDDNLGFMFGYGREARADDADEIWYVTENGFHTSQLAAAPGADVLWAITPLTAAEEQELRAKQLELADALEQAGRADLLYVLPSSLVAYVTRDVLGIDPALTARVRELNLKVEAHKACRCAIIAFDPDNAANAAELIAR
jgi:hypothetical protein